MPNFSFCLTTSVNTDTLFISLSELSSSKNSEVLNNIATYNYYGIYLRYCTNNLVKNNNLTWSVGQCIVDSEGVDNVLENNICEIDNEGDDDDDGREEDYDEIRIILGYDLILILSLICLSTIAVLVQTRLKKY